MDGLNRLRNRCGIGIVLVGLFLLVSCTKANSGIPKPENANDLERPSATQLIPAPATANPNLPSSAPAITASLRSGDQAEFERRLLKSGSANDYLSPEDYGNGPLLALAPNEVAAATGAISLIRDYFLVLSKGEKTDQFCSLAAQGFSQSMFEAYTKELSEIKAIRFLANHRVSALEAAFDVHLIAASSSARLQFYLSRKSLKGQWLISDIQGDSSTLSQATETGYTDYVPTEIERQLIREGHLK